MKFDSGSSICSRSFVVLMYQPVSQSKIALFIQGCVSSLCGPKKGNSVVLDEPVTSWSVIAPPLVNLAMLVKQDMKNPLGQGTIGDVKE